MDPKLPIYESKSELLCKGTDCRTKVCLILGSGAYVLKKTVTEG
jgi:hypothetical protein